MDKIQLIEKMFFEEKKKIVEIANEIGVSKQYVSNKLKDYGEKFKKEKEERKLSNKEKHKKSTVAYISKKRSEESERISLIKQEERSVIDFMLMQHDREIGNKRCVVSNKEFVRRNINAYDVDKTRQFAVFNENKMGPIPGGAPEKLPLREWNEGKSIRIIR